MIDDIIDQTDAIGIITLDTAVKASELASAFSDNKTTEIYGGGYDSLQDKQFDLIINATAASLKGEVPPLPDSIITSETCCYDMMYAAQPTAFMLWASKHQVKNISDGLGMLVGQAAESFDIWRGVKPQVAPVIKSIRNAM